LRQTEEALALQTAGLPQDEQDAIDPQNVVFQSAYYANMPTSYNFTVMEAILEVVVTAFRIAALPLR
jgi:hypothetical protein